MSTQIVSTLGVLEGRPRSFGSVHQKYESGTSPVMSYYPFATEVMDTCVSSCL
jgi:hypothetical protein